MHIRHILCPTDFSESSGEAFETALMMATDSGARLTLLHVQQLPAPVFPDVILPVSPSILRDAEQSAEHAMERLCERARAAGVAADCRVTVGAPHVEICDAAEEVGADLIVMGTHGRTGLSHVILGSVAEKVVRKAQCPVLTVRSHMHATFAHP
jgi:nucleotide-binding universal stress UspA family protein